MKTVFLVVGRTTDKHIEAKRDDLKALIQFVISESVTGKIDLTDLGTQKN